MARKSGRNADRLVSYVYGLDSKHELESVAVYVNGKSVRMSGPNFSTHSVHPSNSGSASGWLREISIVWHLTDLFEVPASLLNSEFSRQKIEKLKQIGEERKQAKP